jgi:DNA-binding PadR family transcriptional regulator
MAQRGRMLAWAGESQYYTEPKRLAELGYLAARKEPGKTRDRTVYTLTERGIEALREYAETAVTFTPVKSDPLLRLMICDLVGEDVTRRSMATLREDLADIRARLADAEQTAHELPHREKNLMLVIRFLHRLLDLHDDLVDEVQRELAATPGDEPARSADADRVRARRARGARP